MNIQTLFPSFTSFSIPTSTDPPVSIYGLHTPNSTKPPLLLMHGYPQTLAIWNKVVPGLLPHFNVVLIDLRGYGRSSKPSALSFSGNGKGKGNGDGNTELSHALYKKSTMAADANAVMQSLGHTHYSVLAHDRGGRVAHKLAVDFPHAVDRLMVLDICPTLAMYEATNQAFASAYYHWFFLIQPSPFPEDAITGAPEAFAKKQLAGLVKVGDASEVFAREAKEDYEVGFGDWDTVHAWCEDYRAAAKEDLEEQRADLEAGRKIQCPVAVLWGSFGVVEKMFDARKEWEKVAGEGCVRLAESVHSGHYVPEEAPEETLKHVLDFWEIK